MFCMPAVESIKAFPFLFGRLRIFMALENGFDQMLSVPGSITTWHNGEVTPPNPKKESAETQRLPGLFVGRQGSQKKGFPF